MAEELGSKETVDFKELLISQIVMAEALMNLLGRNSWQKTK
ncbi:hypothetical protein ACFL0Q_02235 [Thermodesulfobacteriota bacterium]